MFDLIPRLIAKVVMSTSDSLCAPLPFARSEPGQENNHNDDDDDPWDLGSSFEERRRKRATSTPRRPNRPVLEDRSIDWNETEEDTYDQENEAEMSTDHNNEEDEEDLLKQPPSPYCMHEVWRDLDPSLEHVASDICSIDPVPSEVRIVIRRNMNTLDSGGPQSSSPVSAITKHFVGDDEDDEDTAALEMFLQEEKDESVNKKKNKPRQRHDTAPFLVPPRPLSRTHPRMLRSHELLPPPPPPPPQASTSGSSSWYRRWNPVAAPPRIRSRRSFDSAVSSATTGVSSLGSASATYPPTPSFMDDVNDNNDMEDDPEDDTLLQSLFETPPRVQPKNHIKESVKEAAEDIEKVLPTHKPPKAKTNNVGLQCQPTHTLSTLQSSSAESSGGAGGLRSFSPPQQRYTQLNALPAAQRPNHMDRFALEDEEHGIVEVSAIADSQNEVTADAPHDLELEEANDSLFTSSQAGKDGRDNIGVSPLTQPRSGGGEDQQFERQPDCDELEILFLRESQDSSKDQDESLPFYISGSLFSASRQDEDDDAEEEEDQDLEIPLISGGSSSLSRGPRVRLRRGQDPPGRGGEHASLRDPAPPAGAATTDTCFSVSTTTHGSASPQGVGDADDLFLLQSIVSSDHERQHQFSNNSHFGDGSSYSSAFHYSSPNRADHHGEEDLEFDPCHDDHVLTAASAIKTLLVQVTSPKTQRQLFLTDDDRESQDLVDNEQDESLDSVQRRSKPPSATNLHRSHWFLPDSKHRHPHDTHYHLLGNDKALELQQTHSYRCDHMSTPSHSPLSSPVQSLDETSV